jgi:outer membrane protein OmpA-like peptidoglycan-associated protein
MHGNQSSYSRWTWIVALILALILLLLLLTDHGPTSACCVSSSETAPIDDGSAPSAIITPIPDSFSFKATANEFTNEGDGSLVAWFSHKDQIKTLLNNGADWVIYGDDKTMTLTGTADTELVKQQTTKEFQTFFGADAVISNQMIVSSKVIEATLPPPDIAKLYFDLGKASLPTNTVSTLEPIILWLENHDSSKAIISGYHDTIGNNDKNKKLAKARAQAVYDTLVVAGIDTTRIEMRKPQETTGSGDLAEARRVEVSIE